MPQKADYEIEYNGGKDKSMITYIIAFIIVVGVLVGMFLVVDRWEQNNKPRFDEICYNPRDVPDLSCFELQEAIWVCPKAMELFEERNCTFQNRTMKMVNHS